MDVACRTPDAPIHFARGARVRLRDPNVWESNPDRHSHRDPAGRRYAPSRTLGRLDRNYFHKQGRELKWHSSLPIVMAVTSVLAAAP